MADNLCAAEPGKHDLTERLAFEIESLDSAEEWIPADLHRWPTALCAAHAYELLGEPDRARASYEEARSLLEMRRVAFALANRK